MRAILFEGPRRIRLIDDVATPEIGEGEVLVRCTHVALCGSSTVPYTGEGRWSRTEWPAPPGWMGHENLGEIAESRCDDWAAGTRVLAHPRDRTGFSEYFVSRGEWLERLPSDAPDPGVFVVAQPLATVLRALARIDSVAGQTCAIVGQGPMGLIFTHMLSRAGAARVIGVDLVPWRLDWSRRLGATDVIDASQQDTVEAVRDLTGGEMVDFCVEAAGTREAVIASALLPRRRGRLCVFGVPHHDSQEFPWLHVTAAELDIFTSRGTVEATEYFGTAIDMVAGENAVLAEIVTPFLPWERAAEAFEMYTHPAEHEGTLKLTLVL